MSTAARLLLLVLAPFVTLQAQDHGGGHGDAAPASNELPANFSEPLPLYTKALGAFTRPISSSNAEAQAYFNQGFQMMYAFAKLDAVRSFREAWRRDPNCAICYWGEAWAWGSYLNGPMAASESPHAYAAAKKAAELAGHANEVERAFIEAISVRYVEKFDPEKRRDQDEAYAEAMRMLHERFPNDLDAATLYADALFLLEPRRGTRDINDPNVQRLHKQLEEILAIDIKHPGACHLYIHATESTVVPGKAEACTEFIGSAIPGASHINHMPSHTWNEIGRWGDSVRANIQAWHSDLKAEIGEGFAIYPSHNLHMLLFAASMDGQGAIAMQAGRDYERLTGDPMYRLLTLVRFGRFNEILDLHDRPTGDLQAGIWDFAKGYAELRKGDPGFAPTYLARVEKAMQTDEQFRNHPAKGLLGILAAILEGEIDRHGGRLDQGIAALRKAVERDDALMYDEPEPLPFDARHWLGAALLAAERYAEAEQVYRLELLDHPHNGWSLLGLQQALAAQGKPDSEVDQDFDASWARSDTWIRGSRF
jgi:tetratricopeptide (TPR) repeat protein